MVSTQCIDDPALPQRPPQVDQPVDIHTLGEGVVDRLPDQRMIGDLDRAAHVLLAGGGVGEQGGQQIIALHPLDRRRVTFAVAHAEHDQRPIQVPPPPGLESGLVEDRLGEGLPDDVRSEEVLARRTAGRSGGDRER